MTKPPTSDAAGAVLPEAVNKALHNLQMIAEARDLVTGELLAACDMRRLARDAAEVLAAMQPPPEAGSAEAEHLDVQMARWCDFSGESYLAPAGGYKPGQLSSTGARMMAVCDIHTGKDK